MIAFQSYSQSITANKWFVSGSDTLYPITKSQVISDIQAHILLDSCQSENVEKDAMIDSMDAHIKMCYSHLNDAKTMASNYETIISDKDAEINLHIGVEKQMAKASKVQKFKTVIVGSLVSVLGLSLGFMVGHFAK